MTVAELKSLLGNYKHLTKKVYRLAHEINDIENAIKQVRDLSAMKYNHMPKAHGYISDKTAQKAINVIALYEERLNKLLDDIGCTYQLQTELTDLIYALPQNEQSVIEARYIKCLSWDQIPTNVSLSRSSCFRLHDLGIYKLLQMIESVDLGKYEKIW